MIPDFINFTLDHCKKLILGYQETKDTDIFNILLARFDRYILYVVHEMRKSYPYLRNEEMQDLYHTGILGFHEGLCSFKSSSESIFILAVLKVNIKAELSKFYSYKDKEKGCDVLPDVPVIEEPEKDLELRLLFDFIGHSKDLNEKEKKLLTLRYKEGKTVREISGILGKLEVTVYKRLSRVVKRLKVLLMDSII